MEIKDIEKHKYYADPKNPEKVICIFNCSIKERTIIEACGWLEIPILFIHSPENQNA